MINNYKEPQKNGKEHELDFSSVLENAFNNFKQIFGIAGVAMLIFSIVYMVLLMGIAAAFFGFSGFTETITQLSLVNSSPLHMIVNIGFSVVISGIFANISAGFYKMAYSAQFGKSYEIGTMFDYFKTKYFKELFLSGALIALATSPFGILANYFNIPFISMFFIYAFYFFTVLTIPLIIFSDMKALDAIIKSFQLVANNFLMMLGLIIVSFILSMLGFIALCIGIFFTLPFIYSTVFSIYNCIYPIKEQDVIDQIGISEE